MNDIKTAAPTPEAEHAHLGEIADLNTRAVVACRKWNAAKQQAKELKDIYEDLLEQLVAMISAGPERMPLFEDDQSPPADSVGD